MTKAKQGEEVYAHRNTIGGPLLGQRVIVTDIDSVLVDICTPINDWLMKEFGVPVENRDWLHWDLGQSFGIPEASVDELWEAFSSTSSEPYPGAIPFIQDLRKRGYFVIGLSKRGGKLLEMGKKDFACLPLDEIHINKGDKGRYLEQTLALDPQTFDMFLDDKPANLGNVQEHYPLTETLLFDQPWNASLDINPEYHRMYSYAEVLEFVDSMTKTETDTTIIPFMSSEDAVARGR